MFFINPFIYAAGADFESIATVTVPSGGASSIEFTSIPGTYQHLQIRGIVRTNRTGFVVDNIRFRFNSDTGSNYAYHELYGGYLTTASVGADGGSSATFMNIGRSVTTSVTASTYSAVVIDMLDYASTSKTKTVRLFSGFDINGTGGTSSFGGTAVLKSGLWNSTSAITSVTFTPETGTQLTEHSTLALYGIKAP